MSTEQNRVNIAPLARRYRTEGFSHPRVEPDVLLSNPSSLAEAEGVWNTIKPEFFALFSLFTEAVIKRAYSLRDSRPVHIDGLNLHMPFVDLAGRMRVTLAYANKEEFDLIKSGETSPITLAAFNRAQTIMDRIKIIIPGSIPGRDRVEQSILGGINTASDVMSNLLGVIPALVEDKDIVSWVQIARNSYPLIGQLAMSDAGVLITSLGVFRGVKLSFMPFQREYFTIEGEGDRSHLALSQKGKEVLQEAEGKRLQKYKEIGIEPSPTVGCPAMINFNGGSAIRKLWDWHIEIAEQVYPRIVSDV